MKDQIVLCNSMLEPQQLGWTYLGQIDRDDCWENTGVVYCKAGKFAVFNEAGPDMEFKEYLFPDLAMLYLTLRRMKSLKENPDPTPNPDDYGKCERCGRPLSEYDFMHSQGNHCALCFSQAEIGDDSSPTQ